MRTCPTCHGTFPATSSNCPNDGTPLRDLKPWADGSIIRGKYRIIRRVGTGGMATVYQAEHVHFREVCALKVIKMDVAHDEVFVERFLREAVLTRRLQHPNAVRVDDIDSGEDERPFIVMEYLEGPSLHEVMFREAPLAHSRVKAISKQIAGALGAAHELGIVHRDIKPANIILVKRPEGEVAKVLDFGIAKAKEARLESAFANDFTLTGFGLVVGTPQYMSPEQASGKRGDELDGRSDLYSLGVVMFEMLAGKLPVHADSDPDYLTAHIRNQPANLRTLRPELPEAISGLVMDLLAKDPNRRPASAAEVIEVLDQWGMRESKPTRKALVKQPKVRPLAAPVPGAPSAPANLQTRWALAAVVVSVSIFVLAIVQFVRQRTASAPDVTPTVHVLSTSLSMESGDMVLVPGGTALLGQNNTRQYVKAFYIDKTEVSARAYFQFCDATKRACPEELRNEPDLPMRNVDFADAQAFAKWAHKRLPTAAEWEKAARGPRGSRFPWSDDLGSGMAFLPQTPAERDANNQPQMKPAAVDSFPQGASYYGAVNMAGNVWEWVDGPPQLRSGSFRSYAPDMNLPFEGFLYAGHAASPDTRGLDIGFRCAKTP